MVFAGAEARFRRKSGTSITINFTKQVIKPALTNSNSFYGFAWRISNPTDIRGLKPVHGPKESDSGRSKYLA